MNHIYKIVFNKATGTMTAVSEFARGHGKGSLRTKIFRPAVFRLSLLVVALGLAGVVQAAEERGNKLSTRDDEGNTIYHCYYSQEGGNNVICGGESTLVEDRIANSIAIGKSATLRSNSINSVAIGNETAVTNSANATAIGNNAKSINSEYAIALGTSAKVENATNGIAMGRRAEASQIGAVALGSGSVADRVGLTVVGLTASTTADAAQNSVYSPTDTTEDNAEILATVKGTNNGAVSVGNTNTTRQIINVAAGSADSDAVNVAQLKATAAKYFADKDVSADNPATDKATAKIMPNRVLGIKGKDTAIELDPAKDKINKERENTNNITTTLDAANNTVSVELNSHVKGLSSLQFGDEKIRTIEDNRKQPGITIGNSGTKATHRNIAIGDNAQAIQSKDKDDNYNLADANAIAIGSSARAGTDDYYRESLTGNRLLITQELQDLAYLEELKKRNKAEVEHELTQAEKIEILTIAAEKAAEEFKKLKRDNTQKVKSGFRSIAVGGHSSSLGDDSIALGHSAIAQKQGAMALGFESMAYGESSIAFGVDSEAGSLYSTALGTHTHAYARSATALGERAEVAFGATAGTALGAGAHVSFFGESGTAIGTAAQVYAQESTAVGSNAQARKQGAVALGSQSVADRAGLPEGATTASTTPNAAQNSVYSPTNTEADNAEILATVKGTENGAVSVGATDETTRQIINVAAGSADSDAVNVAQLKAVAGTPTYFHVNDGTDTQEAGDPDTNKGSIKSKGGAVGSKSLAAGVNAKASVKESTAVGYEAIAAQEGSAFGASAKATGLQSSAFGIRANATGNAAAAFGSDSNASGAQTVSIGYATVADGDGATALGNYTNANGYGAIAIGSVTNAKKIYSTVVGSRSTVEGANSGIFGSNSVVKSEKSYTSGINNVVGATSNNVGAFGNNNQIGAMTTFDTDGTLKEPVELTSEVDASGSRVIGNYNIITSPNTYVLGSGINSKNKYTKVGDTVANSVYLGDNSTARATTGLNYLPNSDQVGNTTTAGVGALKPQLIVGISGAQELRGPFAGNDAVGVVSVGASGAERRIQNVAAGELSGQSTDAVNGSQLYNAYAMITDIAAAAKVQEGLGIKVDDQQQPNGSTISTVSVKVDDKTIKINGEGQLYAEVGGADVNTYFHYNDHTNQEAGDATTNYGDIKTAGGALGQHSLAAGRGAKASVKYSTAVGYEAIAEQESSVFGASAKTTGLQASAFGFRATADKNATAFGGDAKALGNQANAIGYGTTANGGATALGAYSQATGNTSIAIGNVTKATETYSIAIGPRSVVEGSYSGAFGANSVVKGGKSYTSGINNIVGATSNNVGAFGNNNQIGAITTYRNDGSIQEPTNLTEQVTVSGSHVIGNNNIITSSNTYVLGSSINNKGNYTKIGGTVSNSVYLGDDSSVRADQGKNHQLNSDAEGDTTTGGAKGTVNNAIVNGITYSDFVGKKAVGAVSVGASGAERRIQNVAAGEISATSTDAINGSQLHNTINTGHWKLQANSMPVENIHWGDTVNFTSSDKTVVITSKTEDTTSTLDLKVNTDDTTINKAADGKLKAITTAVTATGNVTDNTKPTFTATTGSALVTGETLANTANTLTQEGLNFTGNNNAFNVHRDLGSQLVIKGGATGSVSDKNTYVEATNDGLIVKIAESPEFTTVTATNSLVIGNGNTTTLTSTLNGLDVGGDKITNVKAGENPADAVNKSQLDAAKTTVVGNGPVTVTPGTPNANGTTYTVSVETTTPQVARGNVTVTETDKNKLMTAGNIATAITDSEKTSSVVSGDTAFVTVNPGNEINGNTEYTVGLAQGVKDSLKKADTAVQSFTTAVNSTTVDTIDKDNKVINFVNGNVTTATNKNDDITFDVNVDGTTIKVEGDKLTANTTTITYANNDGRVDTPADGNALAKASDVVNAINNAAWKAKSGGNKANGDQDTAESIKAGDEVEFVAGDNLTVKRTGKTFEFATTKTPIFTSVQFDEKGPKIQNDNGNIKVSNENGDPTKITNVKAGENPTDAVNKSQLDAAQKAATTKVEGDQGVLVTDKKNTDGSTTYTVAVKTDDNTIVKDLATGAIKANTGTIAANNTGKVTPTIGDENKVATVTNVANAINNSGFNVIGAGNIADGANPFANQLIKPSNTVTLEAGKNLTVAQEGGKFTFATKDDVDFNTVSTQDLLAKNAGVQNLIVPVSYDPITNKLQNIAINKDGIDMANMPIINLQSGVGSTYQNPQAPTDDEKQAIAKKVNEAKGDQLGNAVNVGDLQAVANSAGFNLAISQGTGMATGTTTDKFIKSGNKVDFKADKGIKLSKVDTNDGAQIAIELDDATKQSLTKADTAMQSFKTQVNGVSEVQIKNDGVVNFANGTGTTAQRQGNNITFNVTKATLTTNADNTVTADNKGDAFATAQNVANVINNAVATTSLTSSKTGRVYDPADPDKLVKAGDIVDAINNSGFTLNANYEQDGQKINNGGSVNFVDGQNIAITRDGNKITVATKDDVSLKSASFSDGAGNQAAITGSGVIVSTPHNANNPVTLTANGLSNGGNKITNVANGANTQTINTTGTGVAQPQSTLLNLPDNNSQDGNAVTVGDLKNLGFVVSAQDGYKDTVKNAQEVKFTGINGAVVKGKTQGDVREITIEVNAQSTVESAQTPVVYTDENGNKLVKSIDGNFYPAGTVFDAQGRPTGASANVQPVTNVVASLNNAKGNTTAPMTLKNVASNLVAVNNVDDAQPAANSPDNLASKLSNAATVGDVLNAGWTIQNNDTDIDAINHGNKVNFVNGKGTTALVTSDGVTSNVQFDVETDNTTIKVEGGKVTANTTTLTQDPISQGKVLTPQNDDAKKLVNAGDIATAINNSGFNLSVNTGNDKSLVKAGESVDLSNTDNNIVVSKQGNNIVHNLADTITVTGVNIKGGNVSLTNTGLNNGGNKITNIADGKDDTDAVNVKQLNTKFAGSKENVTSTNKTLTVTQATDPVTQATTFDVAVNTGNSLTVNTQTGAIDVKTDDNTIVKDPATGAIKANTGTMTAGNQGVVNSTPNDGNKLATVDNVVNAINNAGFVVTSGNTGTGTQSGTQADTLIKAGQKVTYLAGNNLDVKQDGANFTFATKDDVEFKTVKIGDTTLSSQGNVLTVGANSATPATLQNGTMTMQGGTQLVNVASAGDIKDVNNAYNAVNAGDLNNAVNALNTQITNAQNASTETVVSKDGSISVTPQAQAGKGNEFNLSVNTDGTTIKVEGGKVTANTTTLATTPTGAVTINSINDAGKLVNAGDIATAINKAGFTLTTSASEGVVKGTSNELIGAGKAIAIDAGKNIAITQTGGQVSIATKDDVEFATAKIGGNVNIANNSVSVGNITLTNEPISVNNQNVNNVNEAINQVAMQAYKPLTFAGDVGNFERKLGETIAVKGGNTGALSDNNIGVTANQDTLTVKLAKDLTGLSSASFTDNAGNKTVVNGAGVVITPVNNNNPVSLTNTGLDNGNNKITNVANGANTQTIATTGTGVAPNATLLNLDNSQNGNVATVGDLKNLGFVVSAQDGYKDTVTNAQEVKFTGINGAVVKGKTEGGVREITIEVNAQSTVESAQTPVVYTDENGNKLVKSIDGKFYPAGTVFDAQGRPTTNVQPVTNVVASLNNAQGSTTAPMALKNVASNLVAVTNTHDAQPVANSPDNLASKLSNAATVGDVLNAGWTIQNNDTDIDAINHGNKVNFVDGNVTTATVTTDGKTSKIQYDVKVDDDTIKVEDGKLKVNKAAIDTNTVTGLIDSDTTTVSVDNANIANPVYKVQVNKAGLNKTNTDNPEADNITLTNAGKVVAPTNDTHAQNSFVTAQTLTDVVNNTGFVATSGVEGTGQQLGAKANTLIKSGETVTYKAGDNLSVKQEGANFTFATKENVKFTTVTTGNTVMDNTGISINNGAAGKPVKLTKNGLDNGGNTIKNVQEGVNETDAVNVAQLKKAIGGATTQIAEGKNVIVKNEKGADGQAVYTVHADSSKVTQGDGIVVTHTVESDENGVKTNDYKVALSEATKNQLKKEESVTSQDTNLLVDNTTTNETGAKEYKLTLNKKIDLTAEGSLTIGDSKLDKEGLTIKGGPTVKKSGIDAGSKKITNVKDGEIRAGSKDAVNGGQLQSELDNIGWDLTVAGNTAKDSEQGSKKVKNKGKVTVSGGKNMVVSRKDSTIELATSSTPEFDSVKVGNTTISSSVAQDGVNEVKISGAKNAQTRITNVAPGLKGTDAVNVNQLNQVKNDIGNLSRKVDKIDRRVRGIGASAAASSALPQVYLPGKSMIAAAGGTYDGATAVSVGYSKASDNSKLILKLQGTATSEGSLSGGVGVGYQW
ncbi:YadA-like family protein [Mannheimia pernigra]|uniref:YadA-like family protein n=1 Tax=Mannheimia pernigra TaxID=111844 RepID=A0ABD7AAX3_9PAST|nr:YadA-like family protein [Mannheimia pernigra]QLB43052.1 YadA-like family protein [Mannheimia pernigra]